MDEVGEARVYAGSATDAKNGFDERHKVYDTLPTPENTSLDRLSDSLPQYVRAAALDGIPLPTVAP